MNSLHTIYPSQAAHSKTLARKVWGERGGWGAPLLILLAAFIATVPLLVHGPSCGHDIDFHIQSWLDAAQQLRHGTLLPHWAFSAAWNAGEPRFIFYPPLSWMFGALLTLIFPIAIIPALYTFLALTAAGLAMHRLASHFAPPSAAVIAAMLYIVNPYMLFTAYERTAYAELLSAAWLPLLLLAALRAKPTIRGIALPIALLWLTNAPAAVMGCYALALIIIVRIVFLLATKRGKPPLKLAATATAGTALGLALPAFYLLPAAYERRFVQIAMAIIPNMRFQDNFLFGRTGDGPHDAVLRTASLLAITLVGTTISFLSLLFLTRATSSPRLNRDTSNTVGDMEPRFTLTVLTLAVLTLSIAFLLMPLSAPVWNHLPSLAFLQFPWRFLSILGAVLALAIALLLRKAHLRPTLTIPITLTLICALTFTAYSTFREGCETDDLPPMRAHLFVTHHGVAPTDEYTPLAADNDVLRSNDPPYWLSNDPQSFAPNTTQNPAATIPNYSGTPTDTLSTPAPQHATIHVDANRFLILNLRDYPNWDIVLADPNSLNSLRLAHIPRDDGLIAVKLYNGGDYTLDITWHRTLDQQLGLAISAIAAAIYLALTIRNRSRRIVV